MASSLRPHHHVVMARRGWEHGTLSDEQTHVYKMKIDSIQERSDYRDTRARGVTSIKIKGRLVGKRTRLAGRYA